MTGFLKRYINIIFILLVPFLFSSCDKYIGYSVVRWNVSEYNLADGTVVPVYIKSNIMQQYVIALPGSGEKAEVPFWQLTSPVSKSKANAIAAKYKDYEHKYAKCVLDGLPVRIDPENGSKQLYRLRQDEVLRTLYKGNGVIPTNGKENLKGEWLRVLTKDGTEGWCFSQNLRLFTMNSDGSYGEGAEEANLQEADDSLEKFLSSSWMPDYYEQMVRSNSIDLDYFTTDFGFYTGSTTGEVRLCTYDLNVTYPYGGVTKLRGGVYRFNNTPLQVTVKNEKSIVVQYTDEKGKPRSYGFVKPSEEFSIADCILQEEERRRSVVTSLVRLGPDFISSNYGTLIFSGDGTFVWQDYAELIPRVIKKDWGATGQVESQYFLPASLKAEWDGILTFRFDASENEINLLYKKLTDGIRLSDVDVSVTSGSSTGRDRVNVYRPKSSLVMFFQNTVSMTE